MSLFFEEFIKSTMQNGINGAIRRARESQKSQYDESEINDLGYHFLNELNRIDDAIEIFKFNIDLFPQSANAYDSLGEAYFVKGSSEDAIENYRKSSVIHLTCAVIHIFYLYFFNNI